jgi:hypothetical protein
MYWYRKTQRQSRFSSAAPYNCRDFTQNSQHSAASRPNRAQYPPITETLRVGEGSPPATRVRSRSPRCFWCEDRLYLGDVAARQRRESAAVRLGASGARTDCTWETCHNTSVCVSLSQTEPLWSVDNRTTCEQSGGARASEQDRNVW